MMLPQTQSKRFLWLILAAFIAPIILAKLALNGQWLDYGVTNKGELVDKPTHLADLGFSQAQQQQLTKHWLLVYRAPAQCDAFCQQSLHSVENSYIALGEEVKRVIPVIISNQAQDLPTTVALSRKAWQQFNVTASQAELNQSQVFIVDTLGNVVLRHKVPTTAEQLPLWGKAILADFKKLLKYSRIG